MASKRKKLACSNRPSLFAAEDDADESRHDPNSDVEGQFGSDTNYEPDGAQEGETSESEYEIFSTRKVRLMHSTKISESPLRSRDSSSSEDNSISHQEVDDRSCNDLSVIENGVEDGLMGSQEPETSLITSLITLHCS